MDQITNERPETVPYIVYESVQMHHSISDRRHWIAHFIELAAIVVIVLAFVWYLNQYDFASYEQDGQGVNIIGNSNGVDFNVAKAEDARQEGQIDGEGQGCS